MSEVHHCQIVRIQHAKNWTNSKKIKNKSNLRIKYAESRGQKGELC